MPPRIGPRPAAWRARQIGRSHFRRAVLHADFDRAGRAVRRHLAPVGARFRCRRGLDRGLPPGAPGRSEDWLLGGGCSTLISTEPDEPSADTLRQLARAFDAAEDWTEACRLARQARRVAHERVRLAECFEIMTQWRAMAEERDDRPVVDEATRELVWILVGWGRTEEARQLEQTRAMEFDEQLPLFFERS